MQWFKRASIRRKQMLIILLTCSAALLLACAAFITYDALSFRRELVEGVSGIAEVVGNNLTAAIDFNDPTAAEQTLASVRDEPNIVLARARKPDGSLFAEYIRSGVPRPSEIKDTAKERHQFHDNYLHLFHPIMAKGQQVGTIELIANLNEFQERLWRFAGIVAAVFVVSLFGALWLSSRLERFVSGPIGNLARVARSIAQEKNYSVRAIKQNDDELGQLIDGFNEMLEQIQQRDAALQAARDNLEKRVEERTLELRNENAERRLAEEAVRESQALYHSLVEQLPVGVFRKDKEGRYVFINSWFCRLKGVEAARLLGKTPHDLAECEKAEPNARHAEITNLATKGTAHHEQIMRTGLQIELEEQYPGANGTPQYLHVVKSPVFGPDGKIAGSQGILLDITERKLAEEVLRQQVKLQDQLAHTAATVPGMIYSFQMRPDGSCRFPYASAALESIFGLQPGDVVEDAAPTFALIHPDDIGHVKATIAESARTMNPWRDEFRVCRTRIGEIWVEGHSVPHLEPDGSVLWNGFIQNITGRKKSEAELAAVHQQLLETSRQAGMAEVATSVLHNVGNVLNSVNVSATLVADNTKKSKAPNLGKVVALLSEHADGLGDFMANDPKGRLLPGYLNQLAGQLAREQQSNIAELEILRKNIEHIKDIVAMQQGYAKVSGVIEAINVTDLVEDALRMNAAALNRHEVQVVREYVEVPTITTDKHKVLQVLVNLIRNAKYACDESGRADKRVTVRVANGETRVKISVIDNGVGIPPENLTRIFNHGFTTRKEGHGFGLHSGALAAKEMGGALMVESAGSGKGAAFSLTLPLQTPKTTS